jgi:hypothetical protein
MDEELFRFVAVRDPQRAASRRVLQIRTWDPDAPTTFVQTLQALSPARTALVAAANQYLGSPEFAGAPDDTAAVVRDVDSRLLAGAPPAEVARTAREGLLALTGALPDTSDADLLTHLETASVRGRGHDSYLAAVIGTDATEAQRAWLDRVVTVWTIIDTLLTRAVPAEELADLLLHAVVVLPDDVTIEPPPPPVPLPRAAAAVASDSSVTPKRYQALRTAWRHVLEATVKLAPVVAVDPAVTDLATLSSTLLSGKVPPESDATLVKEDILFAETPLVELPGIVAARANSALLEHLGAVGAAGPAARRDAVAAEMWRRRGVPPTSTSEPGTTRQEPGIGRLLKAPVIGDLKVVRQTLAGYELGEIAHVENLLAKEHIDREHEIVDLAESELAAVDVTEETHLRDLQTTTRSELSREVARTLASTDAFNVSGTITASYGPYFSATVTGGYASSNSRTESTVTSQRYSQEVVDRATDTVVKRTESYQRTLTRRTVTDKNTHSLTGPDAGNESAVYRWLNKRYCAQVFDYGLRVLLEIGVPDPAVHYRWAAALGGDIDVDVDPPPPLTDPLGAELTPAAIDETNWQALSARFRVADFPAPPAYLITTPEAFAVEPPTAPAAGSGPAQAVAVYKVSKELQIPSGYQPLCFVAGVLADAVRLNHTTLTGAQKAVVIAAITLAAVPPNVLPAPTAEVLATTRLWYDWDPATAPPALSARDLWILGNATLPALADWARKQVTDQVLVSSLRNFLTHVTGAGAATLAIGTTVAAVNAGAGRVGGAVTAPRVIAGSGDVMLPIGYATQPGVAGVAVTLEVLSMATAALRARWQLDAYNAILVAHSSWEADFRAAVAQAEIQARVSIEGRNPLENAGIVTSELKRAVIAMLGGVTLTDLNVVTVGDTRDDPSTGKPTPPSVDVKRAAQSARVVQFYEQAFEWQNMSHVFYPYFWTGRDDWPEALRRRDPDPAFQDFLRAGSARIVLPLRRGWERLVGSRLGLQLPPWPTTPEPSTSPLPGGDPFLDITEEIREAEDRLFGGTPSGRPWSVVLPTTLVAFDGTPMPTYPTACDPPQRDGEDDGDGSDQGDDNG